MLENMSVPSNLFMLSSMIFVLENVSVPRYLLMLFSMDLHA